MKRLITHFLGTLLLLCHVSAWAQEKPIITFGVISDIHSQQSLISGAFDEVALRGTFLNTIQQMKADENLDLLVINGDNTSDVTITEENWLRVRELMVEATRSVFSADAQTPVIYVTGNHDYEVANFDAIPKSYDASDFYTMPMAGDVGALGLTDCYYETSDNGVLGTQNLLAAFHYVVNGVDFVVLNSGTHFFQYAWNYNYSQESVDWCLNKLADIFATDDSKTVFFLIHMPFSDSKGISAANKGFSGTAADNLKKGLAAYPNIIMLYGHDHGYDSAYIREATEERVTVYDSNGNIFGEVGDDDDENIYYVQNYKNADNYLSYDVSTNMGVSSTKNEVTVLGSSFADDTYSFSISSSFLHCGSSGRFSGNSALSLNSSILLYKVADATASIITAQRVTDIESGAQYLLIANSTAGGYYALTDDIYSGGSTSQRMTGLFISTDAPGENISITSAENDSPIWTITPKKEPVVPPIQEGPVVICNYDTKKYLGFNANNLTTLFTPATYTFSNSVVAGAHIIHISGAPTNNPYLYCGSSGRFSGNGDGTHTYAQIELYEVTDPTAERVVATKVSEIEYGKVYLLVGVRGSDRFALTNETYLEGTDSQRMIGMAVTPVDGVIEFDSGATSALWYIGQESGGDDQLDGTTESTPTQSLISAFVGSMRYYNNSIDGSVGVSDSRIVQAMVVSVYNDRIELAVKNYGESGSFVNGTITINEELTPYIINRIVTHSMQPQTATPSFTNKEPQQVGIGASVVIGVDVPESVKIYYTVDGTEPTEESDMTTGSAIHWNPAAAGEYNIKIAARDGVKLFSNSVTSATYTAVEMDEVATPIISVPSGQYDDEIEVELSCATEGAQIYYTLDNKAPSASATLYEGPITISTNLILNAVGIKEGYANSSFATAVYTFSPSGKYCMPTEDGVEQNLTNTYLESVTTTGGLNDTDLNHTATERVFYTRHKQAVSVEQGQSIVLNLNAKSLGEYSTSIVRQDLRYTVANIAIDWNNDGVFSTDESTRIAGIVSADGLHNVGGNVDVLDISHEIQVPASAPEGKIRCRVYYTNAWASNNEVLAKVCGPIKEGLVHDLDLNVLQSTGITSNLKDESNINCFSKDKSIIIEGAIPNTQIKIYDRSGQLVYSGIVTNNPTIVAFDDQVTGMYIVNLITSDSVITQKVMLK